MQCRGIRPHLVVRGKSHGFSRIAAGTWGIFSSEDGDGPSKLVFVLRRQDSCLVARETSTLPAAWQRNRDASPGEVGDPGSLSSCHRDIGIPINFQEESGIVTV